MRSSLIFKVSVKFANRYSLCRMVSISARKMHRDGASTSQSINRSLRALLDADGPAKEPAPSQDSESHALAESEAALLAP